jgi:CHAD domain-containing protein
MTQRLEWNADTDSAQRAARVIGLRALDAVVDARDNVRKRDVESVHKFRVTLRRLRSWIRVYRPFLDDTLRKRTRRRLDRLGAATTELRDLDVHIEWLGKERNALGDHRLEAATWILKSLDSDRKRAWRRFSNVLERDFSRTERGLRRELTSYVVTRDVRAAEEKQGMRPATAQLLREQAAKLERAVVRIRSADDTMRLHRARIIAKRSRYVLEPLAQQQAGLSIVADDLTRWQDVVGELRDAQLLAHRITREVTSIAAERTALVASELVYRPSGTMDFSRIVRESPFDASLSLLFARLRDRIAAASRVASAALASGTGQRLVSEVESAARLYAAE